MTNKAKKIILPRFVVTKVAEASDLGSERVELPAGYPVDAYHIRPRRNADDGGGRRDGKPNWNAARFNLYPVVLDCTGVPWAEANIYLLSRIEGAFNRAMATYASIADDLAAFRRFIDEEGIDWTNFPTHKLSRPTYRYNGHLRVAVAAGEVGLTTAKRRMSSVIGFYKWLKVTTGASCDR